MKKTCWCLLMLTMLGSAAYAVEPLPSHVSIKMLFTTDGSRPYLELQNQERFPVVVEIRPGVDSTIFFETTRIALTAGERKTLNVSVPANSRHLFHLESTVFDTQGFTLAGVPPTVYQAVLGYYQGYVYPISFESAFLNQRSYISGNSDRASMDLGGGYVDHSEIGRQSFASRILPAGTYVEPVDAPSPLLMAAMPLRQLPAVQDLGVIQLGTGERAPSNGTPSPFAPNALFLAPLSASADHLEGSAQSFLGSDSSNFATTRIAPVLLSAPLGPIRLGPITNFRGNLSLQTTDTTYKSAWGWVVRVWQKQLFFGAEYWRFLGWTYVGGDGSWQVGVDSIIIQPGRPVRIEYRTGNRFVQLQDANSNVYTWGDDWSLGAGGVDTGSRFANLTVNGDLPAMDRLYAGATNIWVKFYNNGMNALRDDPIQVTFPNSLASGRCIYNTDASGATVPNYAWSCSYPNGNIWLVPAHGFEWVIQHELGHSIHSFYHGGFPPGSGSPHGFSACYNQGLALTEGFADFLAWWVEYDNTAINPTPAYANLNLESPPDSYCKANTNETRVAATFWDMYDYWNDGADVNTSYDSLYYINQAVPIALFLNNKKNTMPDYLPVVKSGQSAYWQGEFDKLFRLNFMIP